MVRMSGGPTLCSIVSPVSSRKRRPCCFETLRAAARASVPALEISRNFGDSSDISKKLSFVYFVSYISLPDTRTVQLNSEYWFLFGNAGEASISSVPVATMDRRFAPVSAG